MPVVFSWFLSHSYIAHVLSQEDSQNLKSLRQQKIF